MMITITEAANRLSVSKLTIRRWIASGRLTAYHVGDKLVRLDTAEIDEFAHSTPIERDKFKP